MSAISNNEEYEMNHDSDNEHNNNIDSQIQEIYAKLEQLRQNKQVVTTPEETEALEREMSVPLLRFVLLQTNWVV